MSELEELAVRTTGEVAAICGVPPRTVRKWVARGDIPSGPKGASGQGRGNELLWSVDAVAQAISRSKEVRGHEYNRPGMIRGPGRKRSASLPTHIEGTDHE
jgi:hypothetical protein